MGIKGNFLTFLRNKYEIGENITITKYSGKKIAIDTLIYINKYKATQGDKWLNGFFNFVCKLRKNNINCTFIFDSKSPPEKEKEREKRKNNRIRIGEQIEELNQCIQIYETQSVITDSLKYYNDQILNSKGEQFKDFFQDYNIILLPELKELLRKKKSYLYIISPEDIGKAQKVLEALNIQYIIAPFEAESQCAELCIRNKVDCVLSDDSDLFAYLCPFFLLKFNSSSEECILIDLEKVLEKINLTKEQFLDFCILCGTDYNNGKSATKSLELIQKFKKIENINDINFDFKRVRELFSFLENSDNEIILNGLPNIEKLKELELNYHLFISWNTINNINSFSY